MFLQNRSILKTMTCALILAGLSSFGFAQKAAEEPVKFPDTPAGKTVNEFFQAFNSGNMETMKKFHQDHGGSPENADKDKEIYDRTGGLKVHSIKRSEKTEIEVLVQSKNEGTWLNFTFSVSGDAPYAITGIRAQPTSAPSGKGSL